MPAVGPRPGTAAHPAAHARPAPAAAPARPGSRSAPAAGRWRHAGRGRPTGIHVHAQVGLEPPRRHVGEQAQPAAQVQHRLPVAQVLQHAVTQRVAAQLAAGSGRGGWPRRARGGRPAPAVRPGVRRGGRSVACRPSPQSVPPSRCGRRPARAPRAYIRAEGCRPSSATGLSPWSRLISVMSTKATPCWVLITSAAALNSSVSISIAARSRPPPNGVAPRRRTAPARARHHRRRSRRPLQQGPELAAVLVQRTPAVLVVDADQRRNRTAPAARPHRCRHRVRRWSSRWCNGLRIGQLNALRTQGGGKLCGQLRRQPLLRWCTSRPAPGRTTPRLRPNGAASGHDLVASSARRASTRSMRANTSRMTEASGSRVTRSDGGTLKLEPGNDQRLRCSSGPGRRWVVEALGGGTDHGRRTARRPQPATGVRWPAGLRSPRAGFHTDGRRGAQLEMVSGPFTASMAYRPGIINTGAARSAGPARAEIAQASSPPRCAQPTRRRRGAHLAQAAEGQARMVAGQRRDRLEHRVVAQDLA